MKQMNSWIFVVMLISNAFAGNLFEKKVKFLETHDPSLMIWLSDGQKVQVYCSFDVVKKVWEWKKGKDLVLSYSTNSGFTIYDPETGLNLLIVSKFEKHPIDIILEEDIKNNSSTIGILESIKKSHVLWDIELNRAYGKLIKLMPPEKRSVIVDSQIAWIKFRDLHQLALREMYNRDGTMWGIVSSRHYVDLTKEQALRFYRYLAL